MQLAFPSAMEPGSQRQPALDRHIWVLISISIVILVLRSIAINSAQSERIDDEYHIQRGIAFLDHRLAGNDLLPLNDPPVGEGLGVLPLWLFNVWPHDKAVSSALWGQRVSADFILQAIGLWKSLLFVPAVLVMFIWARMLYGTSAGWLAAVWLLADPTVAAHVPLPTPDALAAEAIFIACFWGFLYSRKPNLPRLFGVSFLTAFALVIKHTAIILPGVILGSAIIDRVAGRLRRTSANESDNGRRYLLAIALWIVIVPLAIWAFCLFDISKPSEPSLPQYDPAATNWRLEHPLLAKLTDHPIPGGIYVSSFLGAQLHAERGHPGYLWGVWSNAGRWYYFPAVALYKIPIGFGVLIIMSALSIYFRRLFADELMALIPIIAWTALLMTTRINLGFRHFLPPYLFIILFAARVAMFSTIISGRAVYLAALAGAVQPLLYWPDFISFTNLPGVKVWFHINDSNIDWGQGLKYARTWIDAHPDRKITLRDYAWGEARLFNIRQRVGDGPILLNLGDPQPADGVIIISAMALARDNSFKALRALEPSAVLGHCMLVYDLDQLRKPGEPFRWSRATNAAN